MKEAPKSWLHFQKILLIVGAYMIPLLALWMVTGYPDGFGVNIKSGGIGGLIENLWYSYLLLNHPSPLNVILFCYMWAPAVGLVIWVGRGVVKGLRPKHKIFDDPDGP